MQIEHVALLTQDLEKMRTFYEHYFGAQSGARYENPKTKFQSYFLTFASGSRLEITNKKFVNLQPGETLGYSHLALAVGDQQAVDDLALRLSEDGYPLLNGPRTTGDGYYEAVVQDPEGNLIELTTE